MTQAVVEEEEEDGQNDSEAVSIAVPNHAPLHVSPAAAALACPPLVPPLLATEAAIIVLEEEKSAFCMHFIHSQPLVLAEIHTFMTSHVLDKRPKEV